MKLNLSIKGTSAKNKPHFHSEHQLSLKV